MDPPALIEAIQASRLAEGMRLSLKAMPLVEATHVLAVALVFGSIFIVDLRLLGFSATRAVTAIGREMLRFTWAGFALAVATGAALFAPNAATYYSNTAFRWKLVAIAAAGANMFIFELVTRRGIARWDHGSPPRAARIAGALSILLWIVVIVLGRWIGFSKGYDFSVPDDVQFEFG